MANKRKAGRKALPENEKRTTIQITIKPAYKEYYVENLGREWFEQKIEEEINPQLTEIDLFTKYATSKGVHWGMETQKDLIKLYHGTKYDFGWCEIVDIFLETGKRCFEYEYETGNPPSSEEMEIIQRAVIDEHKK